MPIGHGTDLTCAPISKCVSIDKRFLIYCPRSNRLLAFHRHSLFRNIADPLAINLSCSVIPLSFVANFHNYPTFAHRINFFSHSFCWFCWWLVSLNGINFLSLACHQLYTQIQSIFLIGNLFFVLFLLSTQCDATQPIFWISQPFSMWTNICTPQNTMQMMQLVQIKFNKIKRWFACVFYSTKRN